MVSGENRTWTSGSKEVQMSKKKGLLQKNKQRLEEIERQNRLQQMQQQQIPEVIKGTREKF